MYSLEYNHIQYQINSINENMKELSNEQNYLRIVDDVIYNWVIENGKEPNHIIMHPNTWQYFVSSLAIEGYFAVEVAQESKYRGYKLFRSFDIEENKFEIG